MPKHRNGKGKGKKKGGCHDRDHVDCPRESDDPHMRGEGFGPAPDDLRGDALREHEYYDEEGY